MNKLHLVIFLVINFGCLAVGTWLMNDGPQTEWYINLNKAPWTPPGWVFGATWSLIMILFSVWLTKAYQLQIALTPLYIIQIILNVSWNYIFFNQHLTVVGLAVIIALTLLIWYFFFNYKAKLKTYSYLLLPYMIWLCIATSLNAYVVLNN